MQLDDFVQTTIEQLAKGVRAAQESREEHGALVSPATVNYAGAAVNQSHHYVKDKGLLRDIEFDVVLSESSDTETKGGIGVFLGTVGLGSQGKSGSEASTISRIKFTVPIVLPGCDVDGVPQSQ